MGRAILARMVLVACGSGPLFAAPVPKEPGAKSLVAGLSNPSEKVRNESAAALKNRADALPWLRRAARSTDKDTARRAAELLAPDEKKRQQIVAKEIDACIREGRIDLFMEWHHYWRPENKADLWPVGARAAQAGMDLYAKSCPPEATKALEDRLSPLEKKDGFYDGPRAEMRVTPKGNIYLRTDWWDRSFTRVQFASIAGPIDTGKGTGNGGARCFALGPVRTLGFDCMFLVCDGELQGRDTFLSLIVCHGDLRARDVVRSVLLVSGDVDLTEGDTIRDSLIRATGEVKLPKGGKPLNCAIEAHAKGATAPYKFFELADVGLSLADDEEGLVVTAAKANTPFGNCGIQKGDLIRAIDDTPAGNSEEFRKKVRRAMVRQGDCLRTVARGDRTLDLPVFFPLPK